jgi:hypothetical protein
MFFPKMASAETIAICRRSIIFLPSRARGFFNGKMKLRVLSNYLSCWLNNDERRHKKPTKLFLYIFKGHSNEILCLLFFRKGLFPTLLLGMWKRSNSKRYSEFFFLNSPLSFIDENQYSPYCLIRRVATLHIVYSEELQMCKLCAGILGCYS